MLPIPAVYENGVFRPIGPVSLPEFSRVEVSVAPVCRLPELSEEEFQRLHATMSSTFSDYGDSGETRVAEQHNDYLS